MTVKATEDIAAFLAKLEVNPATKPQSALEHGAAMIFNWSHALTAGDQAKEHALAKEIENAAPGSPFPLRQTVQALSDLDFVSTMGAGNIYRPYNGDMSFGVIKGKLPDNAKIAIIGDWGFGTDDAFYLLDVMLRNNTGISAILHLGDIYWSGTPKDVYNKYTQPIIAAFKKYNIQVPVLSIPGDHEYVSNGEAFYGMLDGETIGGYDLSGIDGTGAWKRDASYFCVRTQSDTWQILGSDSGVTTSKLHPHDQCGLLPDEVKWHQDKLDNFKGKKTIFLTHRQFVSGYDGLSGNSGFNKFLVSDMANMFPKINLFLWGHEHRFVPYVDQLNVPTYSQPLKTTMRLLGAAARETDPVGPSTTSVVKQTAQGDYVLTDTENGLCGHAYAILDLGAETISYFQVSAWDNSTQNPVKSAPATPVLVDKL